MALPLSLFTVASSQRRLVLHLEAGNEHSTMDRGTHLRQAIQSIGGLTRPAVMVGSLMLGARPVNVHSGSDEAPTERPLDRARGWGPCH